MTLTDIVDALKAIPGPDAAELVETLTWNDDTPATVAANLVALVEALKEEPAELVETRQLNDTLYDRIDEAALDIEVGARFHQPDRYHDAYRALTGHLLAL